MSDADGRSEPNRLPLEFWATALHRQISINCALAFQEWDGDNFPRFPAAVSALWQGLPTLPPGRPKVSEPNVRPETCPRLFQGQFLSFRGDVGGHFGQRDRWPFG
jgi:hypothetical protein